MNARVATWAAVAALALLAAQPALAAASPATLLSDAANDQVVVPGTLVPMPPKMANVDILGLTASQGDKAHVSLVLTTSAAVTATQKSTINFTVARGPSSLANSTATAAGTKQSVTVTGSTSASGVTGATASASGAALTLVLPTAGIGAVGGDVLSNFTVFTSDVNDGGTASPVTQDDSKGTDHAPDSGFGTTSFSLERPVPVAAITVAAAGGQVQESNGTRAFAGASVRTADPNAVAVFKVRVANGAADADRVTLTLPAAPSGTRLAADSLVFDLVGHGAANANVTLTLHGAAPRDYVVTIDAASQLGGSSRLDLTVTELAPPAVPARDVVPAALGFLTPAVQAIHLDAALGSYAELGLTLFVLLLAILVVYLALTLRHKPWVRVQVAPSRAVVVPGGTAEFSLRLQSKKQPRRARATVRDAPWGAGLRLGGKSVRTGESVDIDLAALAGKATEGTLRVDIPSGTDADERKTVRFDVVPLDEDGAEVPGHAAHAKVTVQAGEPRTSYTGGSHIRLAEVKHEPPDPRAGATVSTTATVHNDGGDLVRLRVALLVEGRLTVEERIELAPGGHRAVTLPWKAGPGRNQVKVQLFLV
jgi:hypothetical protein